MTWELALILLAWLIAALLPWLLLSRLAGLLSATALLATLTTLLTTLTTLLTTLTTLLTTLLARFVVRVHDCSLIYLSQSTTRS
jgi:hypothetical protein